MLTSRLVDGVMAAAAALATLALTFTTASPYNEKQEQFKL